MTVRPRFAPQLEPLAMDLPSGKSVGTAMAIACAPSGDLFLLHQPLPPEASQGDEDYLPDVVHLTREGKFVAAWGGADHVAPINGVPQWPAVRENIECDAEGNLWIFGSAEQDNAILKFTQDGKLLLRIGQRGEGGTDEDTTLFNRPTSCYHDVVAREVFISDGYGNRRVIAFDSDTGVFTRMWGAYGRHPAELSEEENYGRPVHKVSAGPDGHLYVCDRVKNRIQEFELVPGGVRYLREVYIAPGTPPPYGAAYDIAFAPEGKYIYAADGVSNRVWSIDRESLEVLGWANALTEPEGDQNLPIVYVAAHRMAIEPSTGDLLLACTTRGFRRLRYRGIF